MRAGVDQTMLNTFCEVFRGLHEHALFVYLPPLHNATNQGRTHSRWRTGAVVSTFVHHTTGDVPGAVTPG